MNVTQDENNFYLRAEVPGVKPNELSISVMRNRVSLAGKREIQREHELVSYHRKERAEGSFNRTVTLPMEVEAERVEAKYADGILTVTLPKAEEAKPRQIAVRT
jgi:HSP20 family protein